MNTCLPIGDGLGFPDAPSATARRTLAASRSPSDPFRFERELQLVLAGLNFELSPSAATVVGRREVRVGTRIPDLVYVSFQPRIVRDLWPKRASYRHAHVLWLLRRDGALKEEAIASKTYSRLDRVRSLVGDLLKTGAVVCQESGYLTLSQAMAGISVEIYAVEAKLQRWRQALNQAESYLSFAHQAFVAMDATATPRTQAVITEFESRGIGLIAVEPHSFEWVVRPTKHGQNVGPESEYVIASAATGAFQTWWSSR